MNGNRKVKLTDIAAENFVLYYLIDNLTEIQDDNNQLTPSDFSFEANRAVFLTMSNLAFNGVETVSPVELAKELTVFDGKNINVEEVIKMLQINANNSIISSDKNMFKIHCERLKKLSLLRDLEKSGFDVKEFCGSTDFGEDTDVVNNFTREEIINKYKAKLNDIEDTNLIKQQQSAKEASEGILDLIGRLKAKPEIGEFLDGEIYNYIVSGARYGKFYLNSAPSGAGKTRTMVGNACSLAYPYIDAELNVIVKPKYYPVLFIATEQDHSEIQTLILSYISGVSEDRLLTEMGNLTEEEQLRLELAVKIMEAYKGNFHIEYIPDPNIAIIKTKVGKYVYKHDVRFVFYDYIFSSPGLLGEFRDLRVREDVALMMLSNTLKELATNYQIFIMSGTQLSGDYDKVLFRGIGYIRGSRAVADKADVGSISTKLTDTEREIAEQIATEIGTEMPNITMDIYKNRRGKFTICKVFRKFDYGTCHVKDLFITDDRGELIEGYKILKQNGVNHIKVEDYMKGDNE